jgi:hypothetical protein
MINEDDKVDIIQQKIVDFFSINPNPPDSDIHAFAEKEKIDTHKFEEYVYELLGSFLGAGRSKDFKGEYDEKEMEMGMEIEMEHTTNPIVAGRITMDHLAEIPDYYTRLIKMEKEAEGA